MTTSEKVRKYLEYGFYVKIRTTRGYPVADTITSYNREGSKPYCGIAWNYVDAEILEITKVIPNKPKPYEVGQRVKYKYGKNSRYSIYHVYDDELCYNIQDSENEDKILGRISHFDLEPIFGDEVEEIEEEPPSGKWILVPGSIKGNSKKLREVEEVEQELEAVEPLKLNISSLDPDIEAMNDIAYKINELVEAVNKLNGKKYKLIDTSEDALYDPGSSL